MSTLATDVESRLSEAVQGSLASGSDGDQVGGMRPRWVASPASVDAVSAVLRLASDSGLTVVPRGAGTRLQWGAAPDRCDVVLDLTLLDGLVEHTSGDLVAVAQAGMRLDDLQARLASAGQWLAVDPPRRGTVGGLVATAATGPTRLLHGPVRDLVIGTTMVRADGVVAKSGGKVVKNVAGYDLGKLLTGSYGTLGVIVQVAFRLHPLPESSRWLTVPVRSATEAQDVVLRVAHSHLVAAGVELEWPGGSGEISVRLDGIPTGVEARTLDALALLADAAVESDSSPDWWGTDPTGRDVLLKVTHEVASLGRALAAIDGAAAAVGVQARTRGSAAVGTLEVALDGGDGDAVVGRLREAAPSFGGTVVVLDAPNEVKAVLDVWGPVRGLDLMRRVKDQFDPHRVLSPGRFVGGI
jgi:glycolate oxidase FAD binding subunit